MRARPSCARPSRDHVEEFLRRRRTDAHRRAQRARMSLSAADLGDDAVPFVEHFAAVTGIDVEPERLAAAASASSVLRFDRRCGRGCASAADRRAESGWLGLTARKRRDQTPSSKLADKAARRDAMHRTCSTSLMARTLRQMSARPALLFRDAIARPLPAIALRRAASARNFREQRAETLTPADKFNVRFTRQQSRSIAGAPLYSAAEFCKSRWSSPVQGQLA